MSIYVSTINAHIHVANYLIYMHAGIRWFDIEGKFVIVTVIGVYLEAMALPSLSVKWKGKNAKELTESVPFFRQVVTGEVYTLLRAN